MDMYRVYPIWTKMSRIFGTLCTAYTQSGQVIGNICDIGTPVLVRPIDDQIAQQIWIFPMLRMGHGRTRLLVNRPQAHDRHEPPDPLAAHFMSQAAQMPCHLP